MLAATIVTAVIALQLSSDLTSTVQATGSRQMLAGRIATATSDMSSAMRGVAMSAMLQDNGEMKKAQQQMSEANETVGTSLRQMQDLASDPQTLATLANVKRDHDPMKANIDRIEQMIAAQQIDRAMALFNSTLKPGIERMGVGARTLLASESEGFDRTVAAAGTRTSRGRDVALIVLVAASLVGAIVFCVARSITNRLRAIARHLASCSNDVTQTARQVAATSQVLTDDTKSQAESVHAASSATEELGALTRQNADRARGVAGMVRETEGAVNAGNNALAEMENAMKAIGSSSDKIRRIIKVIDEIAFQTNILALNAAVEAARAGGAGMGFAVVAEEVRNLAHRSASAAQDTAALIEESIARAGEGSKKLGHVSDAIVSITEQASRVKKLAEEVSVGSQEQARGIAEIARTLHHVEQVTHRGSLAADQTHGASHEMREQAETLTATVQQLARMVGGAQTK
jgi:methyl-accepting chemotaxis protein